MFAVTLWLLQWLFMIVYSCYGNCFMDILRLSIRWLFYDYFTVSYFGGFMVVYGGCFMIGLWVSTLVVL